MAPPLRDVASAPRERAPLQAAVRMESSMIFERMWRGLGEGEKVAEGRANVRYSASALHPDDERVRMSRAGKICCGPNRTRRTARIYPVLVRRSARPALVARRAARYRMSAPELKPITSRSNLYLSR